MAALDRELLRRWVGLLADALLPFFFLRLWLAPEAAFDDDSFSLLIVLVGENLVLLAMLALPPFALWKVDDYKMVIGYSGLVLLLAFASFARGWIWSGIAALLALGRFVGVGLGFGKSAGADEFPVNGLQAFIAAAIFWSLLLLLDFGNQHGIHVSASRNVGDMAAHGTIYFSAILGIRVVRLAQVTQLRRRQKLAFQAAFGEQTPYR